MEAKDLRIGSLVKITSRGCDCVYRVTAISEDDVDAKCINRCDPFKQVYNEPLKNVRLALLNSDTNKSISDFCNKYLEKVKNDNDIKTNSVRIDCDLRSRIKFDITYSETCPAIVGGLLNHRLISVDDDDLKYLYDKYSKLI
jgi:hypothetical protein